MSRAGATVSRFIGLSVLGWSGWGLIAVSLHLAGGVDYGGWVVLLLAMAGSGVVGSVVYLLSFDGPARFRTRTVRAAGLGLMWIGALFPNQLVVFFAPIAAVGIVGLLVPPRPVGPLRGRHLARSG